MIARSIALLIALLTPNYLIADSLVQQPQRSFGYFIGDILEQRIQLSEEFQNSAPELKTDTRLDHYLYRISSEKTTQSKQQWLHITYQIINAPLQTQTLQLPAIELKSSTGKVTQVPAWDFTVSPLLTAQNDAVTIISALPDRSGLTLLDKPNNRLIIYSVTVLLTTLALWFFWWTKRNLDERKKLPFAKAHHLIERLENLSTDSDDEQWKALHSAFNQIAGKTVGSHAQHEIIEKAPWLQSINPTLQLFYHASEQRYFYQSTSYPKIQLREFAKELYLLERKQPNSIKP